jgi:polar amino acid transport system substrate-binding protein
MQMNRRWLLAGLGTLVALPAEASALARAQARGTLRIAVEPDAPPFAFTQPTGGLAGYDIDVGAAIAGRLGLRPSYLAPGWHTILEGRWAAIADIAVAGVTPSTARRRRIDLPVRYGSAGVVAIAPKASATTSVQGLTAKRIAVTADTTMHAYLRDTLVLDDAARVPRRFAPGQLLTRVNDRVVMDEVAAGRVDGGVVTLAEAMTAERAGLGIKILPGLLFVEPIAVAVPRGEPALSSAVRDAVESLRGDGTLAALSQTWFGLDLAQ